MNNSRSVGIAVSHLDHLEEDPAIAASANYVVVGDYGAKGVTRDFDNKVSLWPYFVMAANTSFAQSLDEALIKFNSPEKCYLTLEDTGSEADIFSGVAKILDLHNTCLHIHGVLDEFTGTNPNKVLLKRLLMEAPDNIVASCFVPSMEALTEIEYKPIIQQAIRNQGFRMASVYVNVIDEAISVIETVDHSVVWYQSLRSSPHRGEFFERLKTLGVKYEKGIQFPIELVSTKLLQIYSSPGSASVPIRNANVPPNFCMTVYAIVTEDGRKYGRIKQSQEKWVVLEDGKEKFVK